MKTRYRLYRMLHYRRLVAMLAALCLLLAVGCTSPVVPSAYTCTTGPRLYTLPSGVSQVEVDTYVQATPCPVPALR